jgi:hypothetical protein
LSKARTRLTLRLSCGASSWVSSARSVGTIAACVEVLKASWMSVRVCFADNSCEAIETEGSMCEQECGRARNSDSEVRAHTHTHTHVRARAHAHTHTHTQAGLRQVCSRCDCARMTGHSPASLRGETTSSRSFYPCPRARLMTPRHAPHSCRECGSKSTT